MWERSRWCKRHMLDYSWLTTECWSPPNCSAGSLLPDGPALGDVYIDDFALIVIGSLCEPPDLLQERVRRADAAYAATGLPTKRSKALAPAPIGDLWGARVDGRAGTVGVGIERQAALMGTTLCGLAYSTTKNDLERLVGTWAFVAGFRRELFSTLGCVYTAIHGMPARGRCKLQGPAFDELLALCFLGPTAYGDMRLEPLRAETGACVVAATDAAGDGALGACTAEIEEPTWNTVYRLAESRGEHVRLHWVAEVSEPPTALSAQRGASGRLAVYAPWRAILQLPPSRNRKPQHVNVLEARAILLLIKWLMARDERDARLIMLLDSRVCVGAFAKGRSSSRALNSVIRQCAGLAILQGLSWVIVWVPTWANPADAPSRGRSVGARRRSLPEWLADGTAVVDSDVRYTERKSRCGRACCTRLNWTALRRPQLGHRCLLQSSRRLACRTRSRAIVSVPPPPLHHSYLWER